MKTYTRHLNIYKEYYYRTPERNTMVRLRLCTPIRHTDKICRCVKADYENYYSYSAYHAREGCRLCLGKGTPPIPSSEL